MAEAALEIHGLSKRYRLGAPPPPLASWLGKLGRGIVSPFAYLRRATRQATEAETLWALKNLSLVVPQGQAVGIIGRNGAGKTTLLRILSRVTDPTAGEALVRGRVGSLLEVGTGFHPELTGRENVYLNGAIMGMRRAEIKSKFDDIVAFADVVKFIDTPVKYYSSGMFVRLAFSVAAHLEPEVLIVDEVLAVGDVAFQKKCMGKMNDVASQGRTVLLVSHNMESVLGLCTRGIWLHQGQLRQDGPVEDVVRAYINDCQESANGRLLAENPFRQGNGRFRFTSLTFRDNKGRTDGSVITGQPMEVVLDYKTRDGQDLRFVTVRIWISDYMGRQIVCLWSQMTDQDFGTLPAMGRIVCRVPRLNLGPGTYAIEVIGKVEGKMADRIPNAAKMEVAPGDFFGTGQRVSGWGEFLLDHDWRLEV